MTVTTVKTHTTYAVKPGIYWLGDPCYAVPKEQWAAFVDQWYNDSGDFAEVATVDDVTILAFQTSYGDGIYTDIDGDDFSVDAGIIGLTPLELWDDTCSAHSFDEEDAVENALGHWVEVREPWICHNDDGVHYFGPYKIDTENA